MVALRTSKVSRSPSTMAWHSRFSFSRRKKKTTAWKPRPQQPHIQQQSHNKPQLMALSVSMLLGVGQSCRDPFP